MSSSVMDHTAMPKYMYMWQVCRLHAEATGHVSPRLLDNLVINFSTSVAIVLSCPAPMNKISTAVNVL